MRSTYILVCLGRRPGAPKWVPGWCCGWAGAAGGGGCRRQGLLGMFPRRALQRFVEQIIDEDGVVLAVVNVPVICSDKFVHHLQFDRVAEAS